MLRLIVPFVAAALLVTSATAETDWTKYGSFATTPCEDAATIADLGS